MPRRRRRALRRAEQFFALLARSRARRRPRRSGRAATRARDRAAASRCAARAGHRDHDDAPRQRTRVRHRRAARPRARAAPRRAEGAAVARARDGRRPRRPRHGAGRVRGRATARGSRDFVRRAERERDAAERARLLYVATTRARERLHLVWQLPADEEAPPASSLLAHLWPVVSATPREAEPRPRAAAADAVAITPVLRRLVEPAADARQALGRGACPRPVRPEFVWAGQAAAHVGTVVHRYLQRIAEQGLERWSAQRVAESTRRVRARARAARRRSRGARERGRPRRGWRCRARSPTGTAAGCSRRTTKRARSSS